MGSIRASNRFSLPSYLLWPAGIALVVVVVAAAALAIWDRREEIFESYRREMTNLGIVLAEQTARSMQAVDLVLQETQTEVQAAAIADPAEFKQAMATKKFYRFLHDRLENLPQGDAIGLIGDDGILVNGSRAWPTPFLDVSDRDWYAYLRDHDDPNVFVSAPVLGKLTGAWTFFLARRINGSHGEFLGIVVGGIQPRYFEEFYRAITLHSAPIPIKIACRRQSASTASSDTVSVTTSGKSRSG